MSSLSSALILLWLGAPNSVSTTIFSKFISVYAFWRASLYFFAIRITLIVYHIAQITKIASSVLSSKLKPGFFFITTLITNKTLHVRTTKASKKFHHRYFPEFDRKYFLAPVSLILHKKSPVIKRFSNSSSAMNKPDSAT